MSHLAALTLALVVGAAPAFADTMTRSADVDTGRHIGVGVSFEGAAGLSVYADTDANHFVQGSAAWGPSDAYLVTGDFAFPYYHAFASAPVLTPYWGVGAVVMHDSLAYWPRHEGDVTVTDAGLRIPLGLSAAIPKTPVQISGEIVPTVILTPASYSYLQGGISARVLF